MFARVATVFTFLFFVLPFLASATAIPRTDSPAPIPASQCNVNDIQCCNQVQSADSSLVTLLAGLLGVVLGPVEGLVGINCSPLTIIGGGGNSCSAQPVCCTGNVFSGILNLGCSPINVNL